MYCIEQGPDGAAAVGEDGQPIEGAVAVGEDGQPIATDVVAAAVEPEPEVNIYAIRESVAISLFYCKI